MKNLILLSLFALTSLASQAQTMPWSEDWAIPIVITDKNEVRTAIYNYVLIGKAAQDVEAAIGEILGKPGNTIKVTPEYLEYRTGSEVMYRNTVYSKEPPYNFTPVPEVKKAMDLASENKLTKDMLGGPNWIHTIQAMDIEEVNCLAISRKNGKTSGCGDQWQDSLTDDKLACFKGKTYIKCHIECLEKIYDRKIEAAPGPCGEENVQ